MGFLSKILGTNSDYQYQADPNASAQYIKNQQQTAQQQNDLLMALKNQAAGVGPNPAQNMLNQAMDTNNAQGASMIASQKGINPAVASRIAAQNAAQSNQVAAGQGATLGAQQQIAAQNAEMGVMGQQQQANLGQEQMAYNNVNFANQINSGVAAQNASTNAGLAGGVLQAAGSVAAAGAGGATPKAHGGEIEAPSKVHSFLESMLNGTSDVGERLKDGGHVPGKPKVAGNSYQNDTVKALLSPGEVVIPNSVMQSKNPSEGAARFVKALMAKKKVAHA